MSKQFTSLPRAPTVEEGKDTVEGEDTVQEGQETVQEEQGTVQEGQATVEGAEATVPEGEDTVPGGEDTVPGGENTVQGGEETEEGGENTVPEGEDTVPGGEDTVQGQDTVPEGETTVEEGEDTVSRSMVDLPSTSTISPNTTQPRLTNSDRIPNQPSIDQPRPSMPIALPQERRGRDMTRRADRSSLPSKDARFHSLPPVSRATPASASVAVSAPSAAAVTPNAPIIAYTDASCVHGRASGIGIFFGDGHPLNTSRALAGPEHNSGIAEIIAAQTALARILEWKEFRGQPVVIRTDYMGVIDAMNNGNDGRFAGLYADLRRLAERFPTVTFEHVYGHDGERGNEMADQLARDAIRLRRRSATPQGRAGERSRSRSRGGRSRSVTIKGRQAERKSPPKVSDPAKVPPRDPNRSRSRSRNRSRNNSSAEVRVSGERNRPSRENTQRSQRRSQRSRGRNGRR